MNKGEERERERRKSREGDQICSYSIQRSNHGRRSPQQTKYVTKQIYNNLFLSNIIFFSILLLIFTRFLFVKYQLLI